MLTRLPRSGRRARATLSLLAFVALAPGCAPRGGAQTARAEHETPVDAPPARSEPAPAPPPVTVDPASLVVRPATAGDLRREILSPGADATLVNIWATWCGPCREEFPELVKLDRAWRDRGLRVMFVSADFEDEVDGVRAFLARQGVTAPSWIKTGDDAAFIDGLTPKWTGALPATLVYDAHGSLVAFWEGRADYDRFERAVREALHPAKPPS